MNQYPSWRYHQTAPAKIIQSAAEEAEGWYDSPAKVPQLVPGEAVAPSAGPSPAEDVLPVSPAPSRQRGRPRKAHQ